MEPVVIGYISIAIMIALLFSGIPIGVSMGILSLAGMLWLSGPQAAAGLLQRVAYDTFASYDLSVVPLFILMGAFCYYAGISTDLFTAAYKWIGNFRGGLALATIGACAAFAAVSGSSIATAATFSTVAVPEMKKYNYDSSLACGAVASGGTLAVMIPPSIIFVIYGIVTGQSIGRLLIAGLIPGILLSLFFFAAVYLVCLRNPLIGPRGPRATMKEKIYSLKNTWIVLLLFVLVIGGLYLGVFSPSEAAGVGAFGAFVFALARRKLGWSEFKASLRETARTGGMIFIIILGAMLLNYFLAVTRLPAVLSSTIIGMQLNPYVIIVIIVIIYIILGALMDEMGMILLTVPIFFPIIKSLGFDPIWFGVLVVIVCQMGMICPPVGMTVFIVAGIVRDVPMSTVYRGVMPFLVADLCLVAILIAFPQIALWLPKLIKGGTVGGG